MGWDEQHLELPGSGRRVILAGSKHVQWASDTHASLVENVGVNHGRRNVAVPQELLDRSYVVAGFQEVCRERVALMPSSA